jgi:hypothetical protein
MSSKILTKTHQTSSFKLTFMNPISYVRNLKNWLTFSTIVSFFGLFAMVIYLDPTADSKYIVAFLTLFILFLTSSISLLGLKIYFSPKKRLLTILQINQIVYQALISSAVVTAALVMSQTGQLNILTALLLIGGYSLYQLWINSN